MRTRTLAAPHANIERESFGLLADGRGVEAITLSNAGGMQVRLLTFGAVVQQLRVPDREGKIDDVALGYDTLDDYGRDTRFFGAVVGRYANRIANARFTLDGVEYRLPANDGPHHLHGGPAGYYRALWNADAFDGDGFVAARFTLTSPDGDAGYPGTLDVAVTYELTDGNELRVRYHATTDRATPVNLTQHTYFNLAGHDRGDVLGHVLTLRASRYTPVDATRIPTGEIRDVAGTPFDFTRPTALGDRINTDDEQIRIAGGYDHNFVLDRAPDAGTPMSLAAHLYEPQGGRTLEVFTTEPGLQLYAGNGLDDRVVGKQWRVYRQFGGVCLETQHFPNSPNEPRFPSTILRPGQELDSRTIFRFSSRALDKHD